MLLVGVEVGAATMEISVQNSQQAKEELPCGPSVTLLCLDLKDSKRHCRNICTPMFIAAVVMTARRLHHLRCPPTNKQIMKLWDIHIMEFYSAIKKN